jgi:hypothetical protein
MNKLTNLLLLLLTWVLSSTAFTTLTRPHVFVSIGLKSTERDNGDFPPEESDEYKGSVDWDAEWKKVVASESKSTGVVDRPGKDFYKSEAEIAAIKATNKAAERATEASISVANALPDIRSLSGDWKVSARWKVHTRCFRFFYQCTKHISIFPFFLYSFGLESSQLSASGCLCFRLRLER